MHKIAKATTVVLAALLALAVTGCSGPTSSEFVGKWKVADTAVEGRKWCCNHLVEERLDHQDRQRRRR
jgi:hypothetical protein